MGSHRPEILRHDVNRSEHGLRRRSCQRFRDAFTRKDGVTEKRMMGGLCFLLNRNMIGAADRTKDGVKRLMFRVGKDSDVTAAALTGAQPMLQGGHRMTGFFFVEQNDCDGETFTVWLALALNFVSDLPQAQSSSDKFDVNMEKRNYCVSSISIG